MYSDAEDAEEDFTLQSLGAILRFDLTFPKVVTDGTITLSSGSKNSFISTVSIEYIEGKPLVSTPSTGNAQSLTISGINDDHVIAYMMVGAASTFTGLQSAKLTLKAEMTNEEGTSDTYTKIMGTTKSDANWVAGKCYNFDVAWSKPDITYAGSNIYWDGTKLTFAAAGQTATAGDITINEYTQGVLFKWGSLIGISPAQTPSGSNSWSGNEIIYMPTYDSSTSTATWTSGTASDAGYTGTGYTGYSKVPYENSTDRPTGADKNSLDYSETLKDAKWKVYKGDICQFLGEIGAAPTGYRMPRSEEFEADGLTPGKSFSSYNNKDATGTYNLSNLGYATWNTTGIIFPASGYRTQDGLLSSAGNTGRYWSGSADNSTSGLNLAFSSGSVTPSDYFLRQYAFPIRCVKN
jgi:uncharacterized protein (TIGR02145 family)